MLSGQWAVSEFPWPGLMQCEPESLAEDDVYDWRPLVSFFSWTDTLSRPGWLIMTVLVLNCFFFCCLKVNNHLMYQRSPLTSVYDNPCTFRHCSVLFNQSLMSSVHRRHSLLRCLLPLIHPSSISLQRFLALTVHGRSTGAFAFWPLSWLDVLQYWFIGAMLLLSSAFRQTIGDWRLEAPHFLHCYVSMFSAYKL